MADVGVAADAGHGAVVGQAGIDFVDDVLMTFAAGIFGHAPAALLHLDRIVKVARGEGERMKEAVFGFGEILRNESGRRVAVVAGRDRAMARLHLGVEVIPHDVAVGAGVGIVAEIRVALRVNESEAAEPERGADRDRDAGREHIVTLVCGLREPSDRGVFTGVESILTIHSVSCDG